MKHLFSLAALLVLLVACHPKAEFAIDGSITGATDSTYIYLEALDFDSTAMIDSVIPAADGTFAFRHDAPAEPAFYRLRLGKEFITLAIDSTEQLTIDATAQALRQSYQIAGSATNDSIRVISQLFDQAKTSNTPEAIEALRTRGRAMILNDIASSAAYYTLFLRLPSGLIFDPTERKDAMLYAAVTNVLMFNAPESQRAIRIKPFAEYAMAITSQAQQQAEQTEGSDIEVEEVGFLDINLPSIDDKIVPLSTYAKGHYTLVDFTNYDSKPSPVHNMKLDEAIKHYGSRLRIYQVANDADRYLWKSRAAQLPWMCVWESTLEVGSSFRTYNIIGLPTSFLIDPKGNIVERIHDDNTLPSVLRKHIK